MIQPSCASVMSIPRCDRNSVGASRVSGGYSAVGTWPAGMLGRYVRRRTNFLTLIGRTLLRRLTVPRHGVGQRTPYLRRSAEGYIGIKAIPTRTTRTTPVSFYCSKLGKMRVAHQERIGR
jgi:hypothetical protein